MIEVSRIIRYLRDNSIECQYEGSEDFYIDSFSTLNEIKNNSILWIKNTEKFDLNNIKKFRKLLIITSPQYKEEVSIISSNVIYGENSKEIFFTILSYFFNSTEMKSNHTTNSIIKTKAIGSNVKIGFNSYIGPNVEIGNNVVIKNNVSIESRVQIGDGTVVHSGVVIGTDGYGYFQNSKGQNVRVPHFGGVIIGKNVEIGANTCIDRGTLENTMIGNNVKIDNLCHIAHNVVIEDNVSVIALSMIAGSVILKKNSYIAPSAAVRNQLTVGENSTVGIGAVVVKDVETNVVVAGVPAKVIKRMGDV